MPYSAPIESPSMGSYELLLKTGKHSSVRNVLHFENIFCTSDQLGAIG